MKSVSEEFNIFLNQPTLKKYPSEKFYFKTLLEQVSVHRAVEFDQESTPNIKKLQKILSNSKKPIDTKYQVTGFENSTDLIYSHNISENSIALTLFSILGEKNSNLESLILFGDIEILDKMDDLGGIKLGITPRLCEINNGINSKNLLSLDPYFVNTQLSDNMMTFLNHYSKVTRIKIKQNSFYQ